MGLEAAGMMHDLGHPPFGHIAEAVLNKAVDANPNHGKNGTLLLPEVPPGHHLPDGFEGNAQSFRIVTRLSVGMPDGPSSGQILGLNLTRAALSGVSKYPWFKDHRPPGVDKVKDKWGAYDSEEELLVWAMQGINGADGRTGRPRPDGLPELRSVEAQAMDWADDVTYAVHDLEDFARAGLIPLAELRGLYRHEALGVPSIVQEFWAYCRSRLVKNEMIAHKYGELDVDVMADDSRLMNDFIEVLHNLPEAASGRRVDRRTFRSWAAGNIDEFTGPNTLTLNTETGFLDISLASLFAVEVMKKLTWFFVIDRPGMASAQRGQSRIIRELFVWLIDWVKESYDGPETEQPVDNARKSYSLKGLPGRLIDYLDLSFWQGSYNEDARKITRAVVDFISSLTEAQATALYGRLSGVNVGSMLDGSFGY